jgi:hypothetical protein
MYAVTFNSARPTIVFNRAVGSIAPLFAMNTVVGMQDAASLSEVGSINMNPANYVGDIAVLGNVSTQSDQIYTAQRIALGGNQGSGLLNFTSASGRIIFNTPNATAGFVVRDGAALTDINFDVLTDASVVGFTGISGVNSRFNVSTPSNNPIATMPLFTSAGSVQANIVANNNFQIQYVAPGTAVVSVSNFSSPEVCSGGSGGQQESQSQSQSCAR